MTILILGNSRHLCDAISSAYPDHKIEIVAWRGLAEAMSQSQYALIFMVGFDYGSYMKRYEDYLASNVVQPMLALQRFAKPTTPIVYVATQTNRRSFTYSRYRYAKEKLGCTLLSHFPNSYVLRFDTFATSNHEPLVKGGLVTRLIFKYFVKWGVVQTIDMLTVRDRLQDYQTFAEEDRSEVEGMFIAVPRPQFIDRLLRLLIA